MTQVTDDKDDHLQAQLNEHVQVSRPELRKGPGRQVHEQDVKIVLVGRGLSSRCNNNRGGRSTVIRVPSPDVGALHGYAWITGLCGKACAFGDPLTPSLPYV